MATKSSASEHDATAFRAFGRHGITFALVNGALLLRIPYSADVIAAAPMSKGTPEKPGKNKLVANTGGFVSAPGLPPGIRVSAMMIAEPQVPLA